MSAIAAQHTPSLLEVLAMVFVQMDTILAQARHALHAPQVVRAVLNHLVQYNAIHASQDITTITVRVMDTAPQDLTLLALLT